MRDRITILVAAGAISAAPGMGSWATNMLIDDLQARIDDVQADVRELRTLIIDIARRGEPAD